MENQPCRDAGSTSGKQDSERCVRQRGEELVVAQSGRQREGRQERGGSEGFPESRPPPNQTSKLRESASSQLPTPPLEGVLPHPPSRGDETLDRSWLRWYDLLSGSDYSLLGSLVSTFCEAQGVTTAWENLRDSEVFPLPLPRPEEVREMRAKSNCRRI